MFWCPVAPIEQEPEETVGHLHSAGSSSLGRQGIAAGRETLISIAKARTVLGYEPASSWRDALAIPAGVVRDGAELG